MCSHVHICPYCTAQRSAHQAPLGSQRGLPQHAEQFSVKSVQNEAPDLFLFQRPGHTKSPAAEPCVPLLFKLASWPQHHSGIRRERRDRANFAVIDGGHRFLSKQDIDTTGGITQRRRLLPPAIWLQSSARKRVNHQCGTRSRWLTHFFVPVSLSEK